MPKRQILIGVLVALGASVAATVAGAAPQRVTACTTIINPGSYLLSRNINATAVVGDCIIIGTSNVTLDLDGFMIAGPGFIGGVPTGAGVFSSGGFENVVVRNGSVNGFVDGVSLAPVGSVIEGIRALNNDGFGISTGNGARISGNVVQGNGSVGIAFGNGGTVLHNVSLGNGGDGIFGLCPATVVGNTSTGNAGINLNLTNPADCTQADNTAP